MVEIDSATKIPEAQRGVFSVLAPKNAPHEIVYPGTIWPSEFGPTDFPLITAETIGDRLEQLRTTRLKIVFFIAKVLGMLTPHQRRELYEPQITVYFMKGRLLVEQKVDRMMFFRILHPTFNPLVLRSEATLLRGACYILRQIRQGQAADAVDRLLRTPQLDEYLCRELLDRGCLEEEEQMARAKGILEMYESSATGMRLEE